MVAVTFLWYLVVNNSSLIRESVTANPFEVALNPLLTIVAF